MNVVLTAIRLTLTTELWRYVTPNFCEYPNIRCTLSYQDLSLTSQDLKRNMIEHQRTFHSTLLKMCNKNMNISNKNMNISNKQSFP